MIDTEREREAETQAEGEAGSMPGARGRNRSRDSRITPWAKGRRHTAEPPRDTHPFSYWCDLFVFLPSGRPTTLYELMRKADIWLIRTYWDFEYPHPLLPHFDFVGGLHCKPAKSLPTVPDSCFFCFVSSGPFHQYCSLKRSFLNNIHVPQQYLQANLMFPCYHSNFYTIPHLRSESLTT